jgi:hypothetical protein
MLDAPTPGNYIAATPAQYENIAWLLDQENLILESNTGIICVVVYTQHVAYIPRTQ